MEGRHYFNKKETNIYDIYKSLLLDVDKYYENVKTFVIISIN